MIRLLKEQTTFHNDGTRRLREKKEKEDPSKVLLNPSDPEATFRKKAGSKHRGYAANLTETVGENKSLVTDYAYEQNIYSDSQFLKDHLDKEPVYEQEIVMVADGAYGSEPNIAKAAEHGIRLITTNLPAKNLRIFLRTSFLVKMAAGYWNVQTIKSPIRYGMMNTMTAVTHSFVRVIA